MGLNDVTILLNSLPRDKTFSISDCRKLADTIGNDVAFCNPQDITFCISMVIEKFIGEYNAFVNISNYINTNKKILQYYTEASKESIRDGAYGWSSAFTLMLENMIEKIEETQLQVPAYKEAEHILGEYGINKIRKILSHTKELEELIKQEEEYGE